MNALEREPGLGKHTAMRTAFDPSNSAGKATWSAVPLLRLALLGGCLMAVGCSRDATVVRLDSGGDVVGKTVEEMDRQFGAGKPIDFDSLPAAFKPVVTKGGTFRQWSKSEGSTTTTVYAEIMDGKTGNCRLQKHGGGTDLEMTIQPNVPTSK